MPNKTPTNAQVCAILDHDRCSVGWLLAAYVDAAGRPRIERITRIGRVPPRDGAGRLRVVCTDWTRPATEDPIQFVGAASGYGYDKTAAALDGASIAGRVVTDHGRDGVSWKQWIDRLQYGEPTSAELAPIRARLGLPESAPLAFSFVGVL